MIRLRPLTSRRKWTRGSVAVEYGIILPAFVILIFGLIDTGRLFWAQTTLDRAVEAAARCGAVDTIACGTAVKVRDYAVAEAYGLTIASSDFTVAAQACGVKVTAEYPFTLVIPWIATGAVTLKASACYPL